MRFLRRLLHLLLAVTTFVAARPVHPQEIPNQTPAPRKLSNTEERLGVFNLDGLAYTVLTQNETISPAANRKFASTATELEIRDGNGNAAFHESFAVSLGDDQFLQKLSVSGSLLEGTGGRALMLRFIDENPAGGATESWQVFGIVNGMLTRYGPPLPLGQGSSIAVGGVLTGVMLSGGIGVLPLGSTAEALEFRAWTGNFFVYVPVRVDWAHGEWSEAEQCFALDNGALRPNGCNLRIAPVPRTRAEGALTLYTQPEEDPYNSRNVAVHADSAVAYLIARPLVNWKSVGDRFGCSFDDMWLQVRIDGNEGWVRSQADFATLGLPSGPPPQ